MNWRFAGKRALELACWSFVPAYAYSVHQWVAWKLSFLHAHPGSSLSNVTDETIRAQAIWRVVQNHPGWFVWAIVLVPTTCGFLQHLGLRLRWRVTICLIVCSPVIWYSSVAMDVAKKVFEVVT